MKNKYKNITNKYMEKIKLLKKIYSGGIKQKEEVIEVEKDIAERLLIDTGNLDIFYKKLTSDEVKRV